MNKELHCAYKEYIELLENENKKTKLSNPLMIDFDKKDNSKIYIMIFGKETNKWCGNLDKYNIEEVVDTYRTFLDKRGNNSLFWKEFKFYEAQLNKMIKHNKTKYYWNNILKVGKSNGRGTPKNEELKIILRSNILKTELELIRPDIVLFMSGYSYDKHIRSQIEDVVFEVVNESIHIGKLARLSSRILPELSFRTYHPQYLNTVPALRTIIRNEILESCRDVIKY